MAIAQPYGDMAAPLVLLLKIGVIRAMNWRDTWNAGYLEVRVAWGRPCAGMMAPSCIHVVEHKLTTNHRLVCQCMGG